VEMVVLLVVALAASIFVEATGISETLANFY
jgi:hypothetical protein